MGYRVRNADGELQFEHLADLEKAYRAKLIDPDDEVQDEGKGEGETGWIRAGQIRLLKGIRSDAGLPSEARRWYRRGLVLCAATLGLLFAAHKVAQAYGVSSWLLILPLVVVVLGIGLTQTSQRAFPRAFTRAFRRREQPPSRDSSRL